MIRSFVAVINGTKARFFTLQYPELPQYESGPTLTEIECFTQTIKELQGKELWANTKTGSNHGSASQGHGYDDHRQNHLLEFERNFAREIVDKIINLIQEHQSEQIILVAEPQILGMVRDALNTQISKYHKIQELAKDLCKHKPLEIQEYLASKNLLPARKVVSST
jgi:protein required for attachment to host cells